MNAQDIRKNYLDFFAKRAHAVIPRANLVPQDDPTTLFTGSGMQPMVPYLLGSEHPAGQRVVDSQTCFRAEDIDEVGDNRHTTFFEMLGNWSLGDYFKHEQLPWLFEYLTDVVKLDPKRLYVTTYIGDQTLSVPKDTEAAEIWQQLFAGKGVEALTADIGSEEQGYQRGIKSGERIFYYSKKNWWSRTGGIPEKMPAGEPGGPSSEVFFEFTGVEHDPIFGEHCHPNCDCGRFMEIGNSVFMAYRRTETGLEKLEKPNVDFGGGLERIAAAAIDSPDMFKISLLWPIIETLEQITGKAYIDHAAPMRVIADHLRAATFLAVDGVVPSNKEQGYVMRRLLRRAIRFAFDLELHAGLAERIVPIIADSYQQDYPELANNRVRVIEVLTTEERIFRQTLHAGVRQFKKEIAEGILTGEAIFKLHDTYGFPAELSLEEAGKHHIHIAPDWRAAFDHAMAEQRLRSQTATKGQFKGGLEGHSEMHIKYHTATHLMYKALKLVLGDHVVQRGSNITEERLRFDFSQPEKMTPRQIAEVERIVNEQIQKDLKVHFEELPTEEAFKRGASGAFGDRYGDRVKVYIMQKPGQESYSIEICGGPHVEHTAQLAEGNKSFKILKEEACSAGARRIKAALV